MSELNCSWAFGFISNG